MLDEKAFFATINRVAMWNLQTYGMAVKFYIKNSDENKMKAVRGLEGLMEG
jgi:hypothetical protein